MSDKKLRYTFHRVPNVDTSGDGVVLPEGAVLDSVEHVSIGEYVNLTYHLTEEVEDEG